MGKFVRVWLGVLILTLFLTSTTVALGAAGITLQLDGKDLVSDVPPVLQSDRVLLPGRAIFEALGGQVVWNGETQTTNITVNGSTISLVNNSKTAVVNGENVQLDVPAQIIKDRTMLPLRFVAEKSGCTVDWNGSAKLVSIKSPSTVVSPGDPSQPNEPQLPPEPPAPVIADLSVIKLNTALGVNQLLVQAKSEILEYAKVDSEANTFVLDIIKAKLPITPQTVTINHPLFVSLDMKQQDSEVVRITLKLKQGAEGVITLAENKKSLTVDFGNVENQDVAQPNAVQGLPTLNQAAVHKLVVIDAGHGGSDPGSSGKSGGVTLQEKSINLKIAKRTNELLQQAGVRTYMIRTGDETIATRNRPAVANLIGADMFVCIHNNSFDKTSAKGTETLWYDGQKNTQEIYGVTSKRLAEIAQNQLVERMGLTDRGLKERSGLLVLNSTKMPALLIEGGFLSNPGDIAYMLTDDFVEQFAMSAAYAAIQGLNEGIANTY